MRHRLWSTVLCAAALASFACGGAPTRTSPPGQSALPAAGNVAFLSTQGQPAQEVQDMNQKVLAGFNGSVNFNSQITTAPLIDKVLAEQKAGGAGTIDVLGMQHGDFATLQSAGALEDLTPLLQRLEKTRTFPASLLAFGKLGTGQQYYIPWLQATYVMVVNKQALPYLPKGADVNDLTYDQLIAWGANIKKATGESMIGLPAAPGVTGGLLNRFIQGYAYPSYTGGEITGFESPAAVQMWQTLKRLWAVSNPQSTTYAYMQDPLESGEVWIAWDHQARFQDALSRMGSQFLVVPAPTGPKGQGWLPVITGLAIPKNAPNRAGAEELIDWLTRPQQQVSSAVALSFLPTIENVSVTGPGVPAYVRDEANVAASYGANKKAIAAWLEVGLGAQSNDLKLAYQDTFVRIVERNQDVGSSLSYEGAQIQGLLDAAKAPCWPPDPPSTGPCQVG